MSFTLDCVGKVVGALGTAASIYGSIASGTGLLGLGKGASVGSLSVPSSLISGSQYDAFHHYVQSTRR